MKDGKAPLWFKRKSYGWGWYPASKEGWLVFAVWAGLLQLIVFRTDDIQSEREMLVNIVAPVLVITALLILICYKTGESPRWQWGEPKDDETT